MPATSPLIASQVVVRICLFLFAAIAMSGGALQMYLGQPQTAPRLDNVHRFMAGIYFGCGLICLWAAITVRQQRTLVVLIGLAVFLAGSGRLLSMSIVGLNSPSSPATSRTVTPRSSARSSRRVPTRQPATPTDRLRSTSPPRAPSGKAIPPVA